MHRKIAFIDIDARPARPLEDLRLALGRDEPALQPPLNCGCVLVAEQSRSSIHATELSVDHMFGLGKGLMRHGRIYTPKAYTRQTWKAYTRNANLTA